MPNSRPLAPNGDAPFSESPAPRLVDPRNTLNDLSATEWIKETVSVWRQRGLGADHPDAQIEKQHPAPFSFTDVARLIRFFTKAGETVLDPFVGVGSALKAAAIDGRNGVGIELSPEFSALARARLSTELDTTVPASTQQVILEGDARTHLPSLPDAAVDFVVTSPPYWRILRKEDHKARQERTAKGLPTRYSDSDTRDLGNIEDYDVFLEELVSILAEARRVLKPRRYLAAVVGDFRDGGTYHMFHADLARGLEGVGYVLKGVSILHQPHKRVFPYGYPFAYVPNLHHQYILILRNEGG